MHAQPIALHSPAGAADAPLKLRPGHPCRVLVIDNEPAVRAVLEWPLAELVAANASVHIEPTVANALALLALRPFDLILLGRDQALDGGERISALVQALAPATPLVTSSGLAQRECALQRLGLVQPETPRRKLALPKECPERRGLRCSAEDLRCVACVTRMLAHSLQPADETPDAMEKARLLDLAQDAILVRDFGTGRIRFWNKGAERLYGWTADEAVEERLCDLILGGDEWQVEEINRELLRGGEWSGELFQRRRDGGSVYVKGHATLSLTPDGRPDAVFIVNKDITEQKATEADLLRAQRFESIGTLASGVAHDLNNILAPILMSVGLLRREMAPEQREMILTTMELAAERGAQIVKQVLRFGRENTRAPLDVAALVQEILAIVGRTLPGNVRASTELPADLWWVSADLAQLHQVLLNLCVNARDAMPCGGHLLLRARNIELDETAAPLVPELCAGRYVVVEVADSGLGIEPHVLEHIFEPFFTTKGEDQGTGLGLFTVRNIVRSHGGAIAVNSTPGQGTSFQVFLPAAAEAATAPGGCGPRCHSAPFPPRNTHS